MVVGCAGDGTSIFAEELAYRAGADGILPPTFSPLERPAEHLATFLDKTDTGEDTVRVVDDLHQLPQQAAAVLTTALHTQRTPTVFVVDGDVLHAPAAETPALLPLIRSWERGELQRLDLGPLAEDETRNVIYAAMEPGALDDMQVATLAALADGQPLIAADLAAEASLYPQRVPRRYPRPGADVSVPAARALLRLRPRHLQLDHELALAARRLADLSPLDITTAARVIGEAEVSHLLDARIAHRSGDGLTTVAVTPLHSLGLRHRIPDEVRDDPKFTEHVERLAHAGYPMSETVSWRLAQRLLVSASSSGPTSDERAQLLRGADLALQLGNTTDAEALTRTAARADRSPQLDVLKRRLRSELIQARHTEAAATARTALGLPGALSDAALVHDAAVAVAWLPRSPQWWTTLVDDELRRICPAAAAVMPILIGDVPFDEHAAWLLEQVGTAPQAPTEYRLLSLTYLVGARLFSDDEGELGRVIPLVWDTLAETNTVQRATATEPPSEARCHAWHAALIGQLVSGFEPDAVSMDLKKILREATGLSSRTGALATTVTAGVVGFSRLLSGDLYAAEADLHAQEEEVQPAMFPVLWTFYMGITAAGSRTAGLTMYNPRIREVRTQAHSVLRPRQIEDLGAMMLPPSMEDSAVLSAPGPAWYQAFLLHSRMVRGKLEAATAVMELALLDLPETPAMEAITKHATARRDRDPEALLQVGHDFVSINMSGHARHAFAHAQALFRQKRGLARVAEVTAQIRRLDSSLSSPSALAPAATPVGVPDISLTERELEICSLIGEGLTNAEISKQLYLSVRTVESHVLQARGKLGAARRRDIPDLLRQGAGLR